MTGPRQARSRTCSVDICVQPSLARGWCNRHYRRWLNTGSVDGLRKSGPKPKTHCLRGHRLTGSNVKTYRRTSGVNRQCVRCVNYRQRLWRDADRRRRGVPKRNLKPQRRRSIPATVADLLEIEGSWWTKAEIAFRLGVLDNTVQKALSDLTRQGTLTRRVRAGRVEWKTV